MNTFKFKKKEETHIFQSIQLSHPSKYQKYNFFKPNQNSNTQQRIKLQRSYREPKILTKKDRYQIIQNSPQHKQKIRSLSLRKSNYQIQQSTQKSILFKRPVRNKHKTINSSLDNSKPQINSLIQRPKRNQMNKKLTIVDRQSNHSQSKDSHSISKKRSNSINRQASQQQGKKSQSKSKFRVKSTFTKLDSIELVNSVYDQNSSKTLSDKQRRSSSLRKKSYQNIQRIKSLVQQQQYRQALLLIKKSFSQIGDKDNLQLLQLFTISMYNLDQYQQVTKIVQKILSISHECSSQIYIMSCLSYAKLKNYKKALQIIQLGTNKYPQNAEVFYYKGKIMYHTKKYQLAEESFNKSYSICSLPQTLFCLVDCYQKMKQKDKQLKILKQILSQKNLHTVINYQTFFIKKLKVMFQLQQYDQLLHQIHLSQKIINQTKSQQIKAEFSFLKAFCQYKKSMNLQAYQNFQDCIVSQFFYLESLKMLIVLQIKQKNFYEAFHLCGQVAKKGIAIQNDLIFNLLLSFVEGSINLVRRNFKQGIEFLSKVQLSLDTKQFKKYNQCQQWKHYNDIQNYQVFKTVKQLLHLFIGYGLFCIGEYQFCQTAILKQKQFYNDPNYSNGLEYNYKLCQAILSFKDQQYANCLSFLQQADQIFKSRLQVFFYKAVVLIQVLYQTMECQQIQEKFTEEQDQKMIFQIKQNLGQAIKQVSSTANNTKATLLYYKSLFHAYLKQWKQALDSIDQAISKSDDNYWRYFYTKAMILACIHNFQGAITQLSVAINLSECRRPQCFLLRSKCLQIQAKGNQAFYDLQQYIALKPDDDEVHKYAGQILFQNGAFEDALTAFQHKQLQQLSQNYDIFLTLAKTLFLTGKFPQAHQKMTQSYKVRPSQIQILFDANVIKFTGQLIDSINSNTIKQTESVLNTKLIECFTSKNVSKKFGKIFKEIDLYLFQALISIFSGDYITAILHFKKHLTEKRKVIIFDDNQNDQSQFLQNKSQQDLQKTSNQLKIYTNQMKFNIAVCYLSGGDINGAKDVLKDIKIDQNEGFYSNFSKFKNSILCEAFIFEKDQILPNKNKLSQFLPSLNINIKSNNTRIATKLKLCIPFPKVQPPQIFPTFDKKLLRTLTFFGIQGKPQAPWIVKQDNVIKFTQKISYASRLQFNDSEPSLSSTVIIDLDDSRMEQKNRLNTNSNQNSSLFSKRTLKKKNSINIKV